MLPSARRAATLSRYDALLLAAVSPMLGCASAHDYDAPDQTRMVESEADARARPSHDAGNDFAGDAEPVSDFDASAPDPDAAMPYPYADPFYTGDSSEGPFDAGFWPAPLGAALPCEPGSYVPIRAAGLHPAQAHDYLAIRQRTAPSTGGPPAFAPDFGGEWAAMTGNAWSESSFRVLSETGRACAAATGPSCAESIAKHPLLFVTTSCKPVCFEESVVTTRGDEVKRWAGSEQLKLLLGAIDAADEALLLVRAAGYELVCDDAQKTSWGAADDGYEVLALRMERCGSCDGYARLHVTRAGEVTLVGSGDVRAWDTACNCSGRPPPNIH